MSVLENIKARFSVRSYTAEPVSESDLNVILEAARYSQSAKNLQDWKFIIVQDRVIQTWASR